MTRKETQQNLGSLPVDELMDMIKNQSNDSESAENALNEFLRRYGELLKAKCRHSAGLLLKKSSTILNLIYDHAIDLVYYQSATYKPCGTRSTKKAADKHVADWLSVIAEIAAEQVGKHEKAFYGSHTITDNMEAYSDQASLEEPDEEVTDPEADYREFIKRKRLMTLQVVTGRLSPRERAVIDAFTHPMAGKKYLDAAQISAICSKWKISQDNLYQLKHRTFDKIRKLMLAIEESGE